MGRDKFAALARGQRGEGERETRPGYGVLTSTRMKLCLRN